MRMLLMPLVGRLIARMPPSRGGVRWTHQQMGHSLDVLDSTIPDAYWKWCIALMAHTSTMRCDVRGIRSVATRHGVRPESTLTRDQLRAVRAPTLLYWGEADTFGGADLARSSASLLPDARLELVGRAGHLPWLDDPARAARALTNFLDEAGQVSKAVAVAGAR
jgi:pimeloyl-ACP methyl ester carboxylesterase